MTQCALNHQPQYLANSNLLRIRCESSCRIAKRPSRSPDRIAKFGAKTSSLLSQYPDYINQPPMKKTSLLADMLGALSRALKPALNYYTYIDPGGKNGAINP